MSYATRLGKGRNGVKFKVNHRKLGDFVQPTTTEKKQNGKKKKGEKEQEADKEYSE